MNKILKKYLPAIISLSGFAIFLLALPDYRRAATDMLFNQTKTIFLVVPPIFILLGLMDVWVPREKMIKYMGPGSGLRGGVIAFLLGSFAAGPLYGAFPFAAVLMKKGASLKNILIFIGAWSTTKIPMLLFEASALGVRFAVSRLAIDIIGIVIIAIAIQKAMPADEVRRIFAEAEKSA